MSPLRRIGIDLDGVLIDHREHKRKLAAEYGIALEDWQTNANVIHKHVPEEFLRPIRQELYGPLTPNAPQVLDAMKHLSELRAEIFIVSARRIESIRHAQDWLIKHRVYDVVPAERIFFCGVDDEKRGYCERLGIDLFLDDKVNVLEALGSRTKRVLFDEDGMHERLALGDRYGIATTWSQFRDIANGVVDAKAQGELPLKVVTLPLPPAQ